MLGQKEICGLVFFFCCSLAYPTSTDTTDIRCKEHLLKRAKELQKDVKEFFSLLINPEDFNDTSAELPSCDSKRETRHVIKDFHNLFQGLNAAIKDAVYIGGLQKTLKQQEVCLDYWGVPISPVDPSYKGKMEYDNKILLLKASKRYRRFMEKAF